MDAGAGEDRDCCPEGRLTGPFRVARALFANVRSDDVGAGCPKYDPLPGERRCLWYLDNGGCARSDEFMCVEWMRKNATLPLKPKPFTGSLLGDRSQVRRSDG